MYKCNDGKGDIAKHIQHARIYFLLGENSEGNPTIYVGQASTRKNGIGLIQRLNEHKNDENEWNAAIIVTRQSDTIDAAELNYLENKFTLLASEVGRYEVANKCEPAKGNISEEKESEMDEFMANSLSILAILGVRAFEKIQGGRSSTSSTGLKEPLFAFQGSLNAKATISSEGFVLLKGSQIGPTLTKTASNSTKTLRRGTLLKLIPIGKRLTTSSSILSRPPVPSYQGVQ